MKAIYRNSSYKPPLPPGAYLFEAYLRGCLIETEAYLRGGGGI